MGYLGHALKAGVQGFKSGFNMGQMKWQQNEKKRLQKKQDEMMETASIFNNMVAQLGEDGSYSDDDMMKISTSYMALGYDVKERVDGTYKAIQSMDKRTIEANYQYFDLVLDATKGMTSADAQGIFNTIKPFVSGEKGLQMYEALESITKKRADIAQNAPPAPEDIWGQAGKLPMDIRDEYLRSKGIDIPQAADQPPTELELQADTKKKLDYAYATGNASHFNQTAKSLGVPTTFDTYKQKYEKPEGEKTKAPKAVDPNDVLFGTNGIMKDYIGSGSQLGDEQKTEIRNNYDIIKPSLDENTQKQVEDYLEQIGIDVDAVIGEPTVDVIPKKKPFWISDWKYYQGLSDEELYYLADKKDDKKAYEELKKRQ